jgi:hypothetical protein
VKPTADEIKNGWTEETLTAYLKEADERREGYLSGGEYYKDGKMHPYRAPERPEAQNNKYSPFNWR